MAELKPPFSVSEYIAGVYNLVLEENKPGKRTKPRASGLLDCARQQAYMMTDTPRSNPEEEDPARAHQAVTNEMNRVAEDVSVAIINTLGGWEIVDRQVSLPDSYFVTGHPDGRLNDRLTAHDANGMFWGFEHKVIGYRRYIDIFKDGIFTAKPGYVSQALLYGDALGWDAVCFVVLALDAAATKAERTKVRRYTSVPAWAKREDWHPKVQIIAVDLHPLKPIVAALRDRADMLSAAVADGLPGDVKREKTPGKDWNCDYCDWKDRCHIDGEGMVVIPRSPLG